MGLQARAEVTRSKIVVRDFVGRTHQAYAQMPLTAQ